MVLPRDAANSQGERNQELLAHFETDGFAIMGGVLSEEQLEAARTQLDLAASRAAEAGMPTRLEALDPGGQNIRVYDLIENVPISRDLAVHPGVLTLVDAILGDALLSNFTANNALPGSQSMNAHCDQSTVMPEPWPEIFALNAIWCLHDTDEENGATRYLPGSHRITRFSDVPADPKEGMRAFEAKAGSVILMHGRMWHTSGENRSQARERWLLFAFYARSFLRTQCNWQQSLSGATRAELSRELRQRIGLSGGNT
ncbi:MAG: phytanoyl-CoA dioxygenase family protein, partial [Deltaproteobacteria bacterium]|nr:phytanoyl-CoA dioxygenase family protein [Deltaproteobacteria bacterium]